MEISSRAVARVNATPRCPSAAAKGTRSSSKVQAAGCAVSKTSADFPAGRATTTRRLFPLTGICTCAATRVVSSRTRTFSKSPSTLRITSAAIARLPCRSRSIVLPSGNLPIFGREKQAPPTGRRGFGPALRPRPGRNPQGMASISGPPPYRVARRSGRSK